MVKVQVNDTDYSDGRAVVEAKSWFDAKTGQYEWAVPAWEEMGLGELEGPFASRAEAQAALDATQDLITDYGFTA